jgi:hypothetical protein
MHTIFLVSDFFYNIMDTEADIEKAAAKLMIDTKLPKDEVLRMILGRYESQERLEEAVIVRRIIERELSKPEEYGRGLYQDLS